MATPKPSRRSTGSVGRSDGNDYSVKRTARPAPEVEWWRHRLPGPTGEPNGALGDIYLSGLMQVTVESVRRLIKTKNVPHQIYGESYFVNVTDLPALQKTI